MFTYLLATSVSGDFGSLCLQLALRNLHENNHVYVCDTHIWCESNLLSKCVDLLSKCVNLRTLFGIPVVVIMCAAVARSIGNAHDAYGIYNACSVYMCAAFITQMVCMIRTAFIMGMVLVMRTVLMMRGIYMCAIFIIRAVFVMRTGLIMHAAFIRAQYLQ